MLEKFQQDRLDLIKSILPYFRDNFVLKGGTALLLYYGLNRFSEDLDLDSKSNNMNFINKLKFHKDFEKWEISIKKDTDFVFRAMINYGATSNLGNYPLKIEVSNRNKELLQKNQLSYQNINGINVYNIEEIIKMKVRAFNHRDKIRDFYDIGFLLEKYPKLFSKDSLLDIHTKISYAGEEELNLLLQDEIKNNKLIPLENMNITQDYAQKMFKKVENMIINKEDSNQNTKATNLKPKKSKSKDDLYCGL